MTKLFGKNAYYYYYRLSNGIASARFATLREKSPV